VLDTEEDAALASRRGDAKLPLQQFFVDSTTVAFRHSSPCAIQIVLEPTSLVAKPTAATATSTAAQLPPISPEAPAAVEVSKGDPPPLVGSTGTDGRDPPKEELPRSPGAASTGESGGDKPASSGESGPEYARLDLGAEGSTPPAEELVEPEPPAVPRAMEVVAGSKLTGIVQAVDAFGNPAVSAAWWKGRPKVEVLLEQEAIPKAEVQTLSGRHLLAGANAEARVPTTNGTVQHSVKATGGALKNVQTIALVDGRTRLPINATIAGELRLSAELKDDGKAVAGKLQLATGVCSAWVTAAAAEMFDLVPLDQTTEGMRVMVHARDAYGNLDEDCDREVVVELDRGGANTFMTVPNGGLVKLERGVAELTGIRRTEEELQ